MELKNLRESEALLRALVENSSSLLALIDASGSIHYVNLAVQSGLGYTAQELIGASCWDFIHPEDLLPIKTAFARLPDQAEQVMEVRLRHKDGSWRWMEANGRAFFRDGGLMVTASLRDVSARPRVDELTALRASEERFRDIYENSTIGMYQTTPDGRILMANASLLRMLKYESLQEVASRNLEQEGYEPGYERSQFIERINAAGVIQGFESAWKRKDGSTVFVRESARVIRDEQGNPLFYEGTVEDVTERKKSERVQAALYRISEAAQMAQNLDELFPLIHNIVAELMPARNFYIALYDPATEKLVFPYYLDEYDPVPATQKMGGGLTEYVLRTGRTLLVRPETFAEMVQAGEVVAVGAPSVDWLGVPLKTPRDETIGMMAIQTYDENARLEDGHKDILQFVSSQVAMAIERKRAQGAFRAVYEDLAATLDALPDLFFEVDSEGRIYNFRSPQAGELFGRPESFIGKLIRQVMPDPVSGRIMAAIEDAMVKGVHQGTLYPLETAAGLLWFELSIALKGNALRPESHFIVLARDVTARKQIEDALRESDNRLRKAQSMAHVGSWEINLRTQEMWGSEEAFRIYGIERTSQFLPLALVQSCVIQEYRTQLTGTLQALIEGREKYDVKFQIRRVADQALRDIHSIAELALDAAGKPEKVQGVVQDITVQKQAEDEIRRLNDQLELRVRDRTAQLEAANKELESFSYSVSHDLRAPLRAIDGFSAIIQDDYAAGLPPEASRLFTNIQDSARQMNRLIDDLLKFSRLGRQPLNKQPIEPAGLVQQALELLSHEQTARRVEIELGELPGCLGDSGLLLQVWVNLLSNALKYTRGCDPARIQIGSLPVENGRLAYFIRDNGVGFDMTYAGKLFGVFQRLHSSHEFEGNGLGLALVQQIILRHGGRIWAESEPGQGAIFYFTL